MAQRVAVIGAGVVGLACAAQLQMRGHAVSVIDARLPGEYCSFGNAGCFSRASFVPLGVPGMWKKVPGWLTDPSGPLSIPLSYVPRVAPWVLRLLRASTLESVTRIADAMRPLMDATLEKWRPLAQWAGVPELIVQRGYAWAYESEASFLGDAFGRRLREERGVRLEIVKGPAVREIEPSLSPRITHLVVMPEQGHCPNPLRLSQALARRLREGGAQFVPQAAVDFRLREGRVTHVVNSQGEVEADAVVIAAGAHSAKLTAKLGTRVPLETERGYHVTLQSPNIEPRMPIMSAEGKFFATSMEAGLRVAGTVELAGLEAPPNYARADALQHAVRRLFPDLRYAKVDRWMGHRPSLPDSKPVIGRSSRLSNVFFAFGHGHVGLTGAAPTGEIVADLVDGNEPRIDITAFGADRF